MQDLEPNTKLTDSMCPVCGHKESLLYVFPHKLAGVFVCAKDNCDYSWLCEHPSHREETVEHDPAGPEQVDICQTSVIKICNICEVDCTEDKADLEMPEECEGCS